MSGYNYACVAVTTTSASAATVTASITGVAGKQIQVVGFDGSSSDQAVKVTLDFGGTVQSTMHGSLGLPIGRYFGVENGPIAANGVTVNVITTPAATGQGDANLYYRFVN